jgi:hypothetical protein
LGDGYAYTPDGGIRLKGSVYGVASLADQSVVAIAALCIAIVHVALITLLSVTAAFSKKKLRRDAALEVLKVLTGYGRSKESVEPPSSNAELP